MFFESLKHLPVKDKFWLLWASLVDRCMLAIPKHIFRTRNFLEELKSNGFKVVGKGSQFEVSALNGYKFLLRRDTSDLMVFQQIIICEEFKNIVNLIQQHEIKIERIFDAGANIGLSAIYLKQHFPSAEVLCIEPDRSNYEQLIKNVKINNSINSLKNVEVVQAGIWSRNGWMDIDCSFRDGKEWSRRLIQSTAGKGKVPVYSISQLIEKANWESIDLLKMDVEGAEEVIFSESSKLDFLSKTRVVTIEIHDQFKVGFRIIAILQRYGFKLYLSGELMIGIK